MPITEDSASIGTTEYSMPADASMSHPTTLQTDDCFLQLWVRIASIAAGDEFEIKQYETINGTVVALPPVRIVGAQSAPYISPTLMLGVGWDATIKKIAGTDRTAHWTIKKVAFT